MTVWDNQWHAALPCFGVKKKKNLWCFEGVHPQCDLALRQDPVPSSSLGCCPLVHCTSLCTCNHGDRLWSETNTNTWKKIKMWVRKRRGEGYSTWGHFQAEFSETEKDKFYSLCKIPKYFERWGLFKVWASKEPSWWKREIQVTMLLLSHGVFFFLQNELFKCENNDALSPKFQGPK